MHYPDFKLDTEQNTLLLWDISYGFTHLKIRHLFIWSFGGHLQQAKLLEEFLYTGRFHTYISYILHKLLKQCAFVNYTFENSNILTVIYVHKHIHCTFFLMQSKGECEELGESGEYNVYSTFQSHEPDFDYLKSLEIEEKINKIRWLPHQNAAHFLLSTNGNHTSSCLSWFKFV